MYIRATENNSTLKNCNTSVVTEEKILQQKIGLGLNSVEICLLLVYINIVFICLIIQGH